MKKIFIGLTLIFSCIYFSIQTIESNAQKLEVTQMNSKKNTTLDSNNKIKKYLKSSNKSLKIKSVEGVYAEKGNYTVNIELNSSNKGMNYAKNQVVMTIKKLNKKSLKNFSNISISVVADMKDGSQGYAIKSDFSPTFINSDDAKIVRIKNINTKAESWWELS
ncbi:hypothetical protein [Enterococcus alishanensis]